MSEFRLLGERREGFSGNETVEKKKYFQRVSERLFCHHHLQLVTAFEIGMLGGH